MGVFVFWVSQMSSVENGEYQMSNFALKPVSGKGTARMIVRPKGRIILQLRNSRKNLYEFLKFF